MNCFSVLHSSTQIRYPMVQFMFSVIISYNKYFTSKIYQFVQYFVALVKSLFLWLYKYFLIARFNLVYVCVLVHINIHLNTLTFSFQVFTHENMLNISPFTIHLIQYRYVYSIYTYFPRFPKPCNSFHTVFRKCLDSDICGTMFPILHDWFHRYKI